MHHADIDWKTASRADRVEAAEQCARANAEMAIACYTELGEDIAYSVGAYAVNVMDTLNGYGYGAHGVREEAMRAFYAQARFEARRALERIKGRRDADSVAFRRDLRLFLSL